jgi:hypothetical protein
MREDSQEIVFHLLRFYDFSLCPGTDDFYKRSVTKEDVWELKIRLC